MALLEARQPMSKSASSFNLAMSDQILNMSSMSRSIKVPNSPKEFLGNRDKHGKTALELAKDLAMDEIAIILETALEQLNLLMQKTP